MDVAELKKRLREEEGVRYTAYLDSRGIPTVGCGFNLERPDARRRLYDVGADYSKVMLGKASLTDAQVDALLDVTVAEAIEDARGMLDTFDSVPEPVRQVLVDLAFNLGAAGLAQFRCFLGALRVGDWSRAADELVDSKWHRQVKSRALRLETMLREIA